MSRRGKITLALCIGAEYGGWDRMAGHECK